MSAVETHQAVEAIFRIERARLIAGLARLLRNVDLAEELAQDALVIALAEWPRTGVPANPGAWLMIAAKRRAIDAIRRNQMRERKHEEIARELDGQVDATTEAIEMAIDDDLGDELLGLIFAACHPILSADARAALTLRVIGGLTTDEIARAFLSSEATIAQRIVRAKRTIAKAGVSFEVPKGVSVRRDCRRYWRLSTSSSMKAMLLLRATTLSGRACVWRRSAWAACWPDLAPPMQRYSGCWP